jgi:hypothetical protein
MQPQQLQPVVMRVAVVVLAWRDTPGAIDQRPRRFERPCDSE